jgi:hypothetical protein
MQLAEQNPTFIADKKGKKKVENYLKRNKDAVCYSLGHLFISDVLGRTACYPRLAVKKLL